MNQQRLEEFNKWWKLNHHHQPSHKWLVKHAKRCMHNYHIAPEQYDWCCAIMKRYNLGLHKRLNSSDAKFLWRLTHPTMNDRRKRLLATALFFQENVTRKFSK